MALRDRSGAHRDPVLTKGTSGMTRPAQGIAVDLAALRAFASRADGLGGEISAVVSGLDGAASLPDNAFSAVAGETGLPSVFAGAVRAQVDAIAAAGAGLSALGGAVAGAAASYEQGEAERAHTINHAARTR